MSHLHRSQLPLRKLRALMSTAFGLLALALVAQPAQAASISLSGTDPADVAQAPLDVTSGKLSYDASAGKITLTVQTVESNASTRPAMVYALLAQTTRSGQCVPSEAEDAPPAVLLSMAWVAEGDGLKWVLTSPVTVGDIDVTRSGSTLSTTAGPDAALKNLDFDCAQVQTKTQVPGADNTPDDVDVDAMNLFTAATQPVPPPVTTDQPDKDKDGVPDTKDACATVPGAAANGCPTASTALAIRLGAKRVVIDKLVARTSGTVCPLKATVTVTVKKGKKNVTIGKGVVAVSTHGSFCRAYGVVKLKKSAKVAKITVKASGMGAIAATRKR